MPRTSAEVLGLGSHAIPSLWPVTAGGPRGLQTSYTAPRAVSRVGGEQLSLPQTMRKGAFTRRQLSQTSPQDIVGLALVGRDVVLRHGG